LFHAEVFLSDARLQSELQAVLFYNSHDWAAKFRWHTRTA
jgi:hypothetical protein